MRTTSSTLFLARKPLSGAAALQCGVIERVSVLLRLGMLWFIISALLLGLAPQRPRADEIFMPRLYIGAYSFSDMQMQEARLELGRPTFDPASNKLMASGTEWYKASNTWYSIPIEIEIDTDTFRFQLRRQLSNCDNAYDSPSMDPLYGVISYDFRKIVNDLSGEGEHALEDFVFKAAAPDLPFSGPKVASRCRMND